MYPVSNEYKQYLKQQFMGTWYRSKVVLGAINHQAQKNATVQEGQFTSYSSTKITDDLTTTTRYASYERNHLCLDGSRAFLSDDVKWTGLTSENISDENGLIDVLIQINSNLEVALDIKGITLIFPEDVYATDFNLLNKGKEIMQSYEGNDTYRFTSSDVYTLDTTMYIHIKKLNKPNYRLRLLSIKFGVAITFESQNIQSLSYNETMQLISTELPTVDVSVTIDNQDRQYDVENPSSEINFLEQAQIMETYLSIELPSKKQEEIKLCTAYLSDWSAKSDTATFKGTDRLNFLDGIYDEDVYVPKGMSLYQKAVNVFKAAGLEEDEYYIDAYLKTVITQNPLPALSYRECLQLIANAGRCIIKQDREGRIVLAASFTPETKVTSDDKQSYAKLDKIVNGAKKDVYATYENQQMRLDAQRFILSDSDYCLNTGYVSQAMSNDNSSFLNPPKLQIDFESEVSLFAINIMFGATICSEFSISAYLNNGLVEEIDFINDDLEFKYSHMFKVCNKMIITFKRTSKPNQRVYVDGISFDLTTDKHITFNDISQNTLEGTKLETIKQLEVIRTVYTPVDYEETMDIDVNNDKYMTLSFNDPLYNVKVYYEGKDVTISSSAWNATIDLATINKTEVNLVVKGRSLKSNSHKLIYSLNPTGIVKTIENPLINNLEVAKDVGVWVSEYLKSDREYSFNYFHGDASIENGDIIKQESRFGEIQTQVYEHSLSIAGAITGSMKTRKVR